MYAKRVIYLFFFIAGRANSSWIKMYGFPWYYYSGDANKPKVQGVIQSQFHDLLVKSHLVLPIFCASVAQCTKDSFSVSPGVIGNSILSFIRLM